MNLCIIHIKMSIAYIIWLNIIRFFIYKNYSFYILTYKNYNFCINYWLMKAMIIYIY